MTHPNPSRLLVPILVLAALLLLLFGSAYAATMVAQEVPLNQDGMAFELNLDKDGNLLVSDYWANEVWHIISTSGAYTVYQDLPNASDAHMDADGNIWWVDYISGIQFGRVAAGTGEVTTWTLPDLAGLYGTATDGDLVWMTDIDNSRLLSFAPGTGQLCTYELGPQAASDYVVARDGKVWLADNSNYSIIRVDTTTSPDEITVWPLSQNQAFGSPEGLALADDGHLWWADWVLGELAQLDPEASRVVSYTLPTGTNPEMIALQGGRVWYTEDGIGTIGRLDPSEAIGTGRDVEPPPTPDPITPDCAGLDPDGPPAKRNTATGTFDWSHATRASYEETYSDGGWNIYQLPDLASPFGITIAAGKGWVVDLGRQKLLRFPLAPSIYLPYLTRS